MIRLSLVLLLSLMLATLAGAAEVREVRIGEFDGKSRAVIELSSRVGYRIANGSANGQSVALELNDISRMPSAASGQAPQIKGTRLERIADQKKGRIYIDTKGPVKVLDFTLENPVRIVVEFLPPQAGEPVRATQPAAGASKPASLGSIAPPAPAASNSKWVRRIIIDPGHGGHHKGGQGMIGRRQVSEKEVTIIVAEKLERLLKADPRFEVRLTRREDVYMGLLERTLEASRLEGDLFISIHANAVEGAAAQKRAKGFEIWTWNRNSNNSAAAKAIERLENDEPGMKSRENQRILTTMMIDALESQALVSRRFAQAVHARAIEHPYLRANDRGIDSARFKVLEIYDMPSILVELGFMTHPEEVKRLFNAEFQQDWAEIMYEGIVRYYQETDRTFPSTGKRSTTTAKSGLRLW